MIRISQNYKKTLGVILLLLIVADLLLFGKDIYLHNTLFLKTGEIISPEYSETEENYIVYTIKGKTNFLEPGEYYFHSWKDLINPEAIKPLLTHYVRINLLRGVKWFVVLSIAGGLIFITISILPKHKQTHRNLKHSTPSQKVRKTQDKSKPVNSHDAKDILSKIRKKADLFLVEIKRLFRKNKHDSRQENPAEKQTYPYGSLDSIVSYFLELFRIQVKAKPEDPAEFIACNRKTGDSLLIYELRIKTGGKLKKRRMSLRKLGDESGSKGSCFYVMYDHPLVIKFPQPRINDYQDYLTMIKRERIFSKNLQPLTSIVPSLSIILAKYPPEILENSEETDSQLKSDAQWLEYMENHDSMKQYLMIDGSYVLFMDLSSDLLMSQTLMKLSDYKPLMLNETLGNPEFISRPYEFESRYGKIEPDYLEAILDIYRHYEENIKRLSSHFSDISVSRHTCLQLFLLNLLGEDPDPGKTAQEKEFNLKASNYFRSLSHMNPQAVSSCAAAIRSHYSRVNFNHHKQKLICLIKNMTDLLAHMYRNHFVMRDIKPDNMLIVGDSSHFPQFLNTPDSFSIGLIDLETALLMNDSTSFRQPVLGGTPRYALFHQFMLNSVLKKVYNPLDRVFYMQDWYAAAAVIFEITTGRKLYSKTVPFLNRFVKHLKHDFSKGDPKTGIIKNGSHQFWTIAMDEFYIQMNLNKAKLETMHIPVSKDFLTILETELSSVLQQDKKEHSLFLNRCKPLYPEIEKLTHFKSQDLVAYVEKHRDKNGGTSKLKDLDQLGYYTFRFEQNRVYRNLLSRQRLNTYELVSILFYLVFTGLHKAEWGNPKTEQSNPDNQDNHQP